MEVPVSTLCISNDKSSAKLDVAQVRQQKQQIRQDIITMRQDHVRENREKRYLLVKCGARSGTSSLVKRQTKKGHGAFAGELVSAVLLLRKVGCNQLLGTPDLEVTDAGCKRRL